MYARVKLKKTRIYKA